MGRGMRNISLSPRFDCVPNKSSFYFECKETKMRNDNNEIKLAKTEEKLHVAEQKLIAAYCLQMGLGMLLVVIALFVQERLVIALSGLTGLVLIFVGFFKARGIAEHGVTVPRSKENIYK